MVGLILQPTYRVEAGRAVPLYWGRDVEGRSFLVRLPSAPRPCFWVRREEARHRVLDSSGVLDVRDEEARRAIDGGALARVDVELPRDVPPLRERLHEDGVETFEADVRYALRHLIDRGVRGAVEIHGEVESAAKDGRWRADRVFVDPELLPVPSTRPLDFDLRIVSLDIETDWRSGEILSIGLVGTDVDEVIVRRGRQEDEGARAHTPLAGAVLVADERELLRTFADRLREIDPDVVTGWSVIDFDFATILRRAERLGVRLRVGRAPGAMALARGRSRRQASRIRIPGRVVLDGPTLLRSSFIRTERYGLDHVARQVLGEGKTLHGPGRADTIVHWFEHRRQEFVDYNRTDCRLVLEILEALGLVQLSIARSRMTGLPIDRVSSSIGAFEYLYLGELGRRGYAAPSVLRGRAGGTVGGGAVLTPRPGLHRDVVVLDFRSLYPSIMRTFQIDPLAHALGAAAAEEDTIRAPNGARFLRGEGVLPRLLAELFPLRAAAKQAGDEITSTAIKILMNSFFGVLGAPSCRFFDLEISNAITSFGRELLHWTRDRVEELGHPVLYGDTDSLFIGLGESRSGSAASDSEAVSRRARRLVARLNRELSSHVTDTWGVDSHLELEWEKHYLRLFLPPLRHSAEGAAKKYVGLRRVAASEADAEAGAEATTRVEFVGLEAVRRDWTDLARRAQRELYRLLFDDRPVEEFLASEARAVRCGERDDQLVYRKALRKDLGDYTANAPHVVAARRLSERGEEAGEVVEYVMTRGGPEPLASANAAGRVGAGFEIGFEIDYEHYVQRQLRPIAEPVLDLLDLRFERVIGDDRQLDLF